MSKQRVHLIPVVKDTPKPTYLRNGRVVLQCWGATSKDGRYRFDRIEDENTLWETVELENPERIFDLQSTLNNARHFVTYFA